LIASDILRDGNSALSVFETTTEKMSFSYDDERLTFTMEDALAGETAGRWIVVDFECPTGRGMLTARFGERVCDIHDFEVKGEKRQGNGRKTLQALRAYFDHIDIPNPVAWRFWRAMQHEGLLRDLFDMADAYEDREETGTPFGTIELPPVHDDSNPF
jgi:GNAT superfamily N-acetyltransferase